MATASFTPELLRFLTELRAHNERPWFQAHKARYEESVRDPFLHFIAALGPGIQKLSPHFLVDASPVGGSMMRIYRDTRFSRDKTPYKTAVAARFWHQQAREGAAPAFYLRLQPGGSAVGAGIWQPEPAALKQIRQAIVREQKTWQRVSRAGQRGTGCTFVGESLKRAPVGFDPAHPCIEDLKRKDFGLSVPFPLDDRRLSEAALVAEVLASFKVVAPFLAFLSKAVGLPF